MANKVDSHNFPETRDIYRLLDKCKESVVIFDSDWRYVFINRAGLSVLDRSKNAVLGKNVWELLPHIVGSEFEVSAKRAMKNQQMTEIEEYYPHRQRHFRTRLYPSDKYLMVEISDITDLKRAEHVSSQLLGDLHDAMEVYWSEENKERRSKQKGGQQKQ